jgi:predicted Zn-dependent protease
MTQGMLLGVGTQVLGQSAQNSEYGEIIAIGAGLGATAWQARYGRDQELESDAYGMEIMTAAGYDPQGAVELQQTFVKLSEGRNPDWLSGLFASHPPSQARVAANQRKAEKLSGSNRNRAAYEKAIAQINRDQKAYELHEQARTALNNKEYDKALQLVDQAINQQKNENLFWETKAYILNRQDNKQQALSALNQAVVLNPEYFSPLLGRGSLQLNLGNYAAAEKDLIASVGLLETQPAVFLLGEVSVKLGKLQDAIQYYQRVAQSGGELGQTANQRLQQLGVTGQTN